MKGKLEDTTKAQGNRPGKEEGSSEKNKNKVRHKESISPIRMNILKVNVGMCKQFTIYELH